MTRLTPEREQEIRKLSNDFAFWDGLSSTTVKELLSEIDALRAEIRLQTQTNIVAEFKKMIEERDQLKAENEKLKEDANYDLINAKIRRNENEKLRDRLTFLEKVTHTLLGIEQLSLCSRCMAENDSFLKTFNDQCKALAAQPEEK